jgi:STE24 endopeptidase
MSLNGIAGAVLALLLLTVLPAAAQNSSAPADQFAQAGPRAAPTRQIEVHALPVMDTTPQFDASRATTKYLARVSGAARARSNAYFEGGYWLMLLNLVYGLVVAGLLLGLRISTSIRDWAAERTHSRAGQVMIYAAIYVAIVTVAELPLSIYEGFMREHGYGLSNQTFPAWAGDFGILFALTMGLAVLVLPVFYAVIRAARENWWIWSAAVSALLLVAAFALYPVFVAPLFNHYTPLPDGPIRTEILSLARANQIPADTVYVMDASRQSSRISANVSGFLGTTRIALTDNLLKQASHDEVLAVVGHEMGHYVMDHATRLILLFGLVYALGFAFLHWGFRTVTDFFGGYWNVRRVDDVAGLPLLAALASVYLFAMTPVTNSILRSCEAQADLYGLNAVRKPDAFASVMLKLSTYRKLEPGTWEERIFYDHPSGRSRIETAMVWKKEHIADPDIRDTAGTP